MADDVTSPISLDDACLVDVRGLGDYVEVDRMNCGSQATQPWGSAPTRRALGQRLMPTVVASDLTKVHADPTVHLLVRERRRVGNVGLPVMRVSGNSSSKRNSGEVVLNRWFGLR